MESRSDKKRIKLLFTIKMLFFILTVFLASALMILQVSIRYSEFKTRAERMRSDFIDQQKTLIRQQVLQAIETIEYQRSLSGQKSKDIIIEQVYEAYDIAENIFSQNNGKSTSGEIKKMIIDALRPIRFNQGQGYFFITGLDGTEILFADRPEMEGLNLMNMKDPYGKFVIRDMIQIVTEKGEGFYEYHWTKPGVEGDDHKKIAFIKYFKPLNCFIGSGLYVEDVENQIKKELISFYSRIRLENGEYIFIAQWDGLSLTGPGQGTNVLDIEDADGFKIVRELIRTAKSGGGYVQYRMPGISGYGNRLKISYTQAISEWKWYVGTGTFVDSIETSIAEMLFSLKKELLFQLVVVLLISVLIILLFIFIMYRITLQLQKDSALFFDSLNLAAADSRQIDLDRIRFEELYQTAGTANKILLDKITAQKNLQKEKEKINATLKSIGDGVITIDSSGKIVLINPAAEILTGWSESEAVGRHIKECFCLKNRNSREIIKCSAELAVETANPVNPEDTSMLAAKSGKELDIEESAVPILDSDGNISGAVLVFRDVTEKLINEQERLKFRKLESLGLLAGGIAHDFNNLLTGIFGNIELAKMLVPEGHQAVKYLESACNAMQSASSLTRQLLTFARGGDPVKKIIDMEKLIIETAGFALRGSRVKLDMHISQDLWHIEADPGQMEQLISNLVINAQQAMPDGGTLYIEAGNTEISGVRHIRIIIKDNGIGIAPQYLEKIFDPYFSTKQKGSGLGLTSAFSIVSRHNGKIQAASKQNEGSVFTIYLPA